MMEYKGYMGDVEYDAESHIFHGDVLNTRDVITFEGETVDEIEKAFHDSVNDYLDWCKKDGIEPEKPYSGRFNVRIPPELHRQAAILAHRRHESLNRFVEEAVHEATVHYGT
jgi:predicted HicB family RNase H-like nuclease